MGGTLAGRRLFVPRNPLLVYPSRCAECLVSRSRGRFSDPLVGQRSPPLEEFPPRKGVDRAHAAGLVLEDRFRLGDDGEAGAGLSVVSSP